MLPKIRIDLKKLIAETEKKLVYSDAPGVDAYEIAGYVFGFDKTDILLQPVREVNETDLKRFEECAEKRAGGYPLQYILGEWDFYGFTFFVDEGVLIPRNETEQIADECCKFLKNKKDLTVLDLCSGTGCIGLAVAANNPLCKVYLADISEKAISCQRKNLKKTALENVIILNYDIFKGFDEKVFPFPDVILCNPPYVKRDEFENLQTELHFEPENAIVGGEDGLDFYRCLAEKWLPYLKKEGFFMFESGEEQPPEIVKIIEKQTAAQPCLMSNLKIKTENDMYGVCRFVSGIKY